MQVGDGGGFPSLGDEFGVILLERVDRLISSLVLERDEPLALVGVRPALFFRHDRIERFAYTVDAGLDGRCRAVTLTEAPVVVDER